MLTDYQIADLLKVAHPLPDNFTISRTNIKVLLKAQDAETREEIRQRSLQRFQDLIGEHLFGKK